MKKRTKIMLASVIIIVLISVIIFVVRSSYANEEDGLVSSINNKMSKKDIKTSNTSKIRTSNDDNYIYFDVELKEIKEEEPYYLDAKVNMSRQWDSAIEKTIKAVIEKSTDNNNFTEVKEEILTLNTDKYLTNQLELTDTRTYFRVSLKANDEAIEITDQNIDMDLDIKVNKFDPKAEAANYTFESNWDSSKTHTFDASETGDYKLEVWGGAGGSVSYCKEVDTSSWFTCKEGQSITYNGGKGGYASGNIHLNKDDKLYITVGRSGDSGNSIMPMSFGTYTNGGGRLSYCADNSSGGGGGDATHIATKAGSLASLSSDKSSILIVAGGGGGAKAHKNGPNYSGNGGAGGGLTGQAGQSANTTCYSVGLGGTQTAAGGNSTCSVDGHDYSTGSNQPDLIAGFGQGGNYSTFSSSTCTTYAGGGGGYYGGAAGYHAPGGGGSSYIGGVTDGVTKSGDEVMPTQYGSSTMTGNSGSGYAKITSFGKIVNESETKITKSGVPVSDVVFVKNSNATGKPLAGAKFRLWGTSDDGDEIDMEATSAEGGKVIFKDIPDGEYSLTETRPPAGHKASGAVYTVEVGDRQ